MPTMMGSVQQVEIQIDEAAAKVGDVLSQAQSALDALRGGLRTPVIIQTPAIGTAGSVTVGMPSWVKTVLVVIGIVIVIKLVK